MQLHSPNKWKIKTVTNIVLIVKHTYQIGLGLPRLVFGALPLSCSGGSIYNLFFLMWVLNVYVRRIIGYQELMSGEAAKERVTAVLSKSKLLAYFRFGGRPLYVLRSVTYLSGFQKRLQRYCWSQWTNTKSTSLA